MTLIGTFGIQFDTKFEGDTGTGRAVIQHQFPSTGTITVESTDKAASITGTIGTSEREIDLNNLVNADNADYDFDVVRDQEVDFTTMKGIVLYNTHATQYLQFHAPSSNSLLTFGETSNFMQIPPNSYIALGFVTALTLNANGVIAIKGEDESTSFTLLMIGT